MTEHAVEHKLAEQAKAASGIMDILRERGLDDDAELVADTIEGETNFLEALDLAVTELDACQVIVMGCKAVESDLEARRNRAEARIEKVRAAIEQALLIAEISEKIVRPTATLSLRKIPPGWVVDDESKVPSHFFKPQPPKLDRVAIKQALHADNIPGCHVDNGGVSLTLRRK